MKVLNALCVILICLSIVSHSVAQSNVAIVADKVNKGKVRVVITSMDDDDRRKPFQVFLERDGVLHEMQYSHNAFMANVREGLYNVVLKGNFGEDRSYRRANFNVAQGKTVSLRIDLYDASENQICNERFGRVMIPNDARLEDSEFTPSFDTFVVDSPFNLVVKYCGKQSQEGVMTYSFALVTYKNFTASTEKLIFDKSKMVLRFQSGKKPGWNDFAGCANGLRNFQLILNSPEKMSCVAAY
jgi:hypothetical protein